MSNYELNNLRGNQRVDVMVDEENGTETSHLNGGNAAGTKKEEQVIHFRRPPRRTEAEGGNRKNRYLFLKIGLIIVLTIAFLGILFYFAWPSESSSKSKSNSKSSNGLKNIITETPKKLEVEITTTTASTTSKSTGSRNNIIPKAPRKFGVEGTTTTAKSSVLQHEKVETKEKICNTPVCVELSKTVRSTMDSSIDPCQDFYRYSCGGWTENMAWATGAGRPVWTPMNERSFKNQKLMHNALSKKSKEESTHDGEQKAAKFYMSCLDEDQREQLGAQPIHNVLKSIDGCPTFVHNYTDAANITRLNMDMSTWSFYKTFKQLSHSYNEHAGLFKWSVEIDPRSNGRHIIMIRHQTLASVGQLSIEYSELDDLHARIMLVMALYMRPVAVLMGIEDIETSVSVMVDVVEFILQLSQLAKQFRSTSGQLYRVMSVNELERKVKMIPWKSFFNDALSQVNKSIFGWTEVLVEEPSLLVAVSELVLSKLSTTEGKVALRNYLMWELITTCGLYLNKEFLNAVTKSDRPEDWQVCLGTTGRVFGLALGSIFRQEVEFPIHAKEASDEMMTNIRQSFEDNVNYEDIFWLDDITRDQALKKVRAMGSVIGYPDSLPDQPKKMLNDLYRDLSIQEDSYFTNVIQTIQFQLRKNWATFGTSFNSLTMDHWDMNPSIATAYYIMRANKVVVSAGMLQEPFFEPGYPKSVQYGSMGVMMGHEVLHAFDNAASLHDPWRPSLNSQLATLLFRLQTQCFKDQYANFTLGTHILDLDKTLNENVADNGALKTAFNAYTKVLESDGDIYLPQLNLTHNQLFFLSSAQLWCAAGTDDGIATLSAKDEHAPGILRVLYPMQNFEEFSKAFGCSKMSPMNPAKKCSVW